MNIFAAPYGPQLNPEDRTKADALVRVVRKSTASLDDAVALADALGLTLHISASTKPSTEGDEE